jgi:hypothetical protein
VVEDVVEDLLTGLFWSRNALPAEYPLTWDEALTFVRQLNETNWMGYADWRLPNRRELRSLMDYETRLPALPAGHPFSNVFSGWYWSSTSAAISPSHAWYVHMEGARMFYGGKDQSYMLWPVRGSGNGLLAATGQTLCYDSQGNTIDCAASTQDGAVIAGRPWPVPRFEVRDGDVVDQLTGLCWQRNADLSGTLVDWGEALSTIRNLAARQPQKGWRLPNINELETLVDCSRHSPALPGDAPITDVQSGYWSSTTSRFEPDWAWALYMDKGAVGVGQKAGRHFHAWAVRDSIDP